MDIIIECIICKENIINEFCLTNCQCTFAIFHQKCLSEWNRLNNRYPCCNLPFKRKPSRYNKRKRYNPYGLDNNHHNQFGTSLYALNFNFMRIISGMSPLQYSN